MTPYAASQSPTKLGLKPGETIRAADAVKALVTQSANDAAVTIAENLAGTEENFARVMTAKAHALGMTDTIFRNASGLPDPEQVTTARDMAILAEHLIRDFPEYYSVFASKIFVYRGRAFRNHNHLLFGYRGTDGIKTGYTRASGYNLVASVRRDDKHLVAVVLGGRTGGQRDAAMRALLDKHFPQALAANSAAPALWRSPSPRRRHHSRRHPRPQRGLLSPLPMRHRRPPSPRLVQVSAMPIDGRPPPANPPQSSRGRHSRPLPRPGGRLHLRGRGHEPARRGAEPRRQAAGRPPPGHAQLPQGRDRLVPRALRRLLAKRRQDHLRLAQDAWRWTAS